MSVLFNFKHNDFVKFEPRLENLELIQSIKIIAKKSRGRQPGFSDLILLSLPFTMLKYLGLGLGFTYNGAKLFNMLPIKMKKMEDPNTFKTMTKEWIWENIPSY